MSCVDRTRAAAFYNPTHWGQLGVWAGEAVRVVHRGAWSAPDMWTWTWTPTDTCLPVGSASC